jgi:hypothetical protein
MIVLGRHRALAQDWGARSKREKPPTLCQHCHGAPGMVTTFADAPFATPEFDALLLEAGRFSWTAGPLTKARTFATARVGMATHSSSSTAARMTRSGSTAHASSP